MQRELVFVVSLWVLVKYGILDTHSASQQYRETHRQNRIFRPSKEANLLQVIFQRIGIPIPYLFFQYLQTQHD